MNNQEYPNGLLTGLNKPDEGIELTSEEAGKVSQFVRFPVSSVQNDTRIAISRITWSSGAAVQNREFPREEL